MAVKDEEVEPLTIAEDSVEWGVVVLFVIHEIASWAVRQCAWRGEERGGQGKYRQLQQSPGQWRQVVRLQCLSAVSLQQIGW